VPVHHLGRLEVTQRDDQPVSDGPEQLRPERELVRQVSKGLALIGEYGVRRKRAQVFRRARVVAYEAAEAYGVFVLPDTLEENAARTYLALQQLISLRAAVGDFLGDRSILRITAIPYTKVRSGELIAIESERESLQSTAEFVRHVEF